MGSRCLPLFVHVGAVHTPAKNTRRVHTCQAELGCILPPMETRCIGLWDKIPSQKAPSKSACGSAGAWASCLLWDRSTSAHPAQAWQGEAGFSSPHGAAVLVLVRRLSGSPAPLQGLQLAPHVPKSHLAIREYWRKDEGSKKWTLRGECRGRSCASCPSTEASLWCQSCPSSKDAGGWFEVRALPTLLGRWHPSTNPQIRQDASPCLPSLE